MTTPSPTELALLNTGPQRTQLYLSIFQPAVALACQVSGSYDTANQSVAIDNITTGSVGNIVSGDFQVCLVGSSPGDDDYGRTWVRSTTASSLRFVESNHINWQDNLYLTVLEFIEIIPVFPRIIQNPDDEEDVIFYKWWDVAYQDQNTYLGTFICMGSHYAGFMTTGTASVYFSSSGTYGLISGSLSYSWTFEGANPATSDLPTPGNVNWITPGHYRVALEVSSDLGGWDRSVRCVSIYDRDTAPPITNWEMIELSGSRDGVGYSGRIRVNENLDLMDGALVVIFKDDWYGSTRQSISKNDKGRENILFVGYILAGTIQQNYRDNSVEFEVGSPSRVMEMTECFGVSVEDNPAPTTWYQLPDLDVRRAAYHYYAWHSTVPLCCDIEARNLDDRPIQYFDADRTSLYDAVNSIIDSALHGRVISDSLGKLWMERDVSVISSGSSILPTCLNIGRGDWIGTPIIKENLYPEVSFLEIGGIVYYSGLGQSIPLLACSPSAAPDYHGKVEKVQGLALDSQEDLNRIAANLYASMNAEYPEVDMQLRGNYANLDIAPQEIITLNIAANDTPRNVVFVQKPFALRGISWEWNNRDQVLLPHLSLSEVTSGGLSEMIIIPEKPPDGGGGGGGNGGTTYPPIQPPVYPIVTGTVWVEVYENGNFIIRTKDLNFYGDRVTVDANLAAQGADIIISDCDCPNYPTGTSPFVPPGFDCGSQNAPEILWYLGRDDGYDMNDVYLIPGYSPIVPLYTGTVYDWCALTAYDGDHTFKSPYYSGLFCIYCSYLLVSENIADYGVPINCDYRFTLLAELDSGQTFELAQMVGNYTGPSQNFEVFQQWNPANISPTFYLHYGDGVRLKLDVQVVDNNGNLTEAWDTESDPVWGIFLGHPSLFIDWVA